MKSTLNRFLCLFIILSFFISLRNSKTINKCVPKGCKLLKNESYVTTLLCQVEEFSYIKTVNGCNQKHPSQIQLYIQTKSNKNLIIDNNSISSFIEYFQKTNILNGILFFNQLKGFNIESPVDIDMNNNVSKQLAIGFGYTLDFYNRKGELIKGCDDFNKKLNLENYEFPFKKNKSFLIIRFYIRREKTEICELTFKNATLDHLVISEITNSYFKSTSLQFESRSEPLYSDINHLQFESCYHMDLNDNVVNENMFMFTDTLSIVCDLRSIQVDVFRRLRSISYIHIKPTVFMNVVRRQGIDWLRSINSHLDVNLSNRSDVQEHMYEPVLIIFFDEREIYYNSNFQFVYDADFCLFKTYPFSQLIMFIIELESKLKNMTSYSCATLWLIQHNNKLFRYMNMPSPYFDKRITDEAIEKCDFKRRLETCNKSSIKLMGNELELNEFTSFDFMILSEFLLIISSPIIAAVGLIVNMITMFVIVKKDNRKEFKENQYKYMAIHSGSNVFICLIQVIRLLSECQLPFGFYCSSIRLYIGIQYINIIFVEYFSRFSLLFSNFTYVAFSLNRLSLIGKDHNMLTKFVSEVGIKKYIGFVVAFSAILPIVKPFRYQINEVSLLKDTPRLVFELYIKNFWNEIIELKLLIIFNVIHDFISYVLFVLVNLIIDLILVKKFREVNKERESKFKDQSELIKEKIKRENDESFRRVLFMVILSSVLNVLLKLPIVITSLNDLRLFIVSKFVTWKFAYFDDISALKFPYTMNSFCFLDKICRIFESFGEFLLLMSLSINFFVIKQFDKKFQAAFDLFRGKNKNPNKSQDVKAANIET